MFLFCPQYFILREIQAFPFPLISYILNAYLLQFGQSLEYTSNFCFVLFCFNKYNDFLILQTFVYYSLKISVSLDALVSLVFFPKSKQYILQIKLQFC